MKKRRVIHVSKTIYGRMTLESVAATRGPRTAKISPYWQLHLWHNGTMYHLWSFEPTNWTCAPSVASEWSVKQSILWHLPALIPVAFSQYSIQLPGRFPSCTFRTIYVPLYWVIKNSVTYRFRYGVL